QRTLDALATQPTRNGFDEPSKEWRKASAEPERFHLDIHAAVVFAEAREAARAPQITAIASGRHEALVGLAGVLDLPDFIGVRDRIRESIRRMEVASG